MKKIFLNIVLTVFLVSASSGQNYWIKQNVPTGKLLRVCSFIDSLRGWAAGDSGVIIHTTNGGIDWTIQETKIFENIHSLFFLNERLGWGLGWSLTYSDRAYYGTVVISTTNGGINWSNNLYPVENYFPNTILFLDSLNGWIGGFPVPLLRTTNGGLNWFQAPIDTSGPSGFPVNHVAFYQNKLGFACGGVFDFAGILYQSTNNGTNWKGYGLAPEPINRMIIFDSLNIIGMGGDYEFGPSIIRTTNGGVNWDYHTLLYWGVPTAASFRTRAEGWVPLGYVPKFLITFDSSYTWNELITPDSAGIFDIIFTDFRNGFCVGDSGAVYKFNYSAVNIKNKEQIIPAEYKLYQNYPNPFNPATIIQYDVPVSSVVRISIYDILGREIKLIVNTKQSPGRYDIKWDAAGYPSGMYFYRLTAENFSVSKCMVLVK